MNRVVDTSAWIEGFIRGGLKSRIRAELPASEAWIVPTIVQLELAKWLHREGSEHQADSVIAFTNQCVVVNLDSAIAMRAADMSSSLKLATADAIIYATALQCGAELLTCDAHFKDLAQVVYLPKATLSTPP